MTARVITPSRATSRAGCRTGGSTEEGGGFRLPHQTRSPEPLAPIRPRKPPSRRPCRGTSSTTRKRTGWGCDPDSRMGFAPTDHRPSRLPLITATRVRARLRVPRRVPRCGGLRGTGLRPCARGSPAPTETAPGFPRARPRRRSPGIELHTARTGDRVPTRHAHRRPRKHPVQREADTGRRARAAPHQPRS